MVECMKNLGSTEAVVAAAVGSEAVAAAGSEVDVRTGRFDCWRAVPTKTV